MRALLPATLIVLLTPLGVLGDSVAEAEAAYAAGRFEQASRLYVEALNLKGEPDLEIEFRLGCCAYRLARHAEAAYRFQRVLEARPRDRRARFNLGLAAARLENPVALEPETGLAGVVGRTTPLERVGLASVVLALALLGAFFGRAPWLRLLLASIIVLCAAIQWQTAVAMMSTERSGLVLDDGATVRQAPHDTAPEAFRLIPADGVVVLEASDRWLRIVCSRGEGWTRRAAIGVID